MSEWQIIEEEFISYTGGTAQLISNGECEIHLWEPPKDAQLFCDKLNAINEENEQLKKELDKLKVVNELLSMDFSNSEHELLKENEHIKHTIKTMMETERTELGQSVLKQLWEQLQ